MSLLRLLLLITLACPSALLAQDDGEDTPDSTETTSESGKGKKKKGKDSEPEVAEEAPSPSGKGKKKKGGDEPPMEQPEAEGTVADDTPEVAAVEGNMANDEPEPEPGTLAAYWKREGRQPRISDFVATRLTFYVGDDNLLAGSDDRSPALGMANEYPELFFEGLNAEKGKVVTETHMVIYSKMPGFLKFVDTEAAFVAEFELSRDPDSGQLVGRFRDDGSWLAATFWFGEKNASPFLKLTAWPFSADRFRLGYLFDLTWGGNRMWARNQSPVPGMKLSFGSDRFYAFVGAKAMISLRSDNNESENFWGVLGGLGPNVPIGAKGKLAYDVNGGYFTRGTFRQPPHESAPVVSFGASHRISFGWNENMGGSADLRLMTNDLNDPRVGFQVSNTIATIPNYQGTFGIGASVEFSSIWGSLIDADDPSQRIYDAALTGGFRARVRFLKTMRVGFDMIYRDVSFLVLNVPGLTPYVDFATDTIQKPQLYGALYWDWFIEKPKLRPGFIIGLMQPASFAAREDSNGNRQVEIIREANDYELLPTGTEPFTILSMKASLRWHLSPMLVIAGEVAFTQDYNQAKNVADPDTGVNTLILDEERAQALGLNLFMQAAF